MLFFNFDLWYSSKDKGDDSTDFLSFGRSLLQMYMASRILIQSSEANKDKFTPFFLFSTQCYVVFQLRYLMFKQRQGDDNTVFYQMLCCFSTPISDVQAETKVMTDFVSFGRSLPQMSKLQGYLFKAQKWKANFIVFFPLSNASLLLVEKTFSKIVPFSRLHC